MGLKFFKRGTYNSVSNALSLIRQEFEALWGRVDNQRTPEESVVAEQQSYIPEIGSPASSGYDGDFTIVVEPQYDDNNTETGYTIKVVNGKLYKEHKDLNYSFAIYVNGEHYLVAAKEFVNIDLTDGLYYVYIVYTAEGVEPSPLGEPASKASVVLEVIHLKDWNYLPSDDADHAYYLIGYVYLGYGNKIYINQGHQSGYVRMYHAMSCSDFLYAVEPKELSK